MNKSLILGVLLLFAVLLIGMIGAGIFAQDPNPTPAIEPDLLTLTQMVIDATARVIETPQAPLGFGSGPPISGPGGTLPPFLMAGRLSENATQFAIQQTANPTPGATIEGCTVPASLTNNNSEKQAELEEIFTEAQLFVRFFILEDIVTDDCVEFQVRERSVLLSIDQADDRIVDLYDTINASIDLLIAQEMEITRLSLGLGSNIDEVVTMPPTLSLVLNISYDDFLANHEEGLKGLNVFLPRSSQ